MTQTTLRAALALALAGTVALAGCKRNEEPAATEPVATTPAPAPTPMEPAPAPATPAAPVAATGVTVGTTVGADRSVAAATTFTTRDDIVVSVRTDASTPANATIDAKLTYQDGQVAGQQSGTVRAEDAGISNITFSKPDGWPAGTYRVEVTLNGTPVGTTQTITVQ